MSDNIAELLGLTEEDLRVHREAPRGCCDRANGDGSDLDQRPCSEGNCAELFCPCGAPQGMGWGPTGCPCQDEDRLPFQDAPRGATNSGSADVVELPDGFSNLATKCDHGNPVYVAFHSDSAYVAIAVVGQDPTCR